MAHFAMLLFETNSQLPNSDQSPAPSVTFSFKRHFSYFHSSHPPLRHCFIQVSKLVLVHTRLTWSIGEHDTKKVSDI